MAARPSARPARRWFALATAALLLLTAWLATGAWLTRPAPADPGPLPAGWSDWEIRIPTPGQAEARVCGWFAPGLAGHGVVLLLHGVRSHRGSLLDRGRWLNEAGFGVLAIDLPAHGRSDGERIGFGRLEAPAVAPVLAQLRGQHPGERLAVVGVSLGAAAYVFSGAGADAVVLESMYPTLDDAVANRLAMRLGAVGRALAPLLLAQSRLWIGHDAVALRPIEHLPAILAPLVIAAGALDRHTPWSETERLFAAASGTRELWRFESAGHEDLYRAAPLQYRQRLLSFLAAHVATPAAATESPGEVGR